MHRRIYAYVLGLSLLASLWAFVWYGATPSVFSDIEIHGIDYGSEPYTMIVDTAERHILATCLPLALLLIISLIGWGRCIKRSGANKECNQQQVDR